MGAECASTCVSKEEQTNEQVDDLYGKPSKSPNNRRGHRTGEPSAQFVPLTRGESCEIPMRDVMKVIRAQSMMRGWLERKRYSKKQMEHESTTKYFTKDEGKETVNGQFSQDQSEQ